MWNPSLPRRLGLLVSACLLVASCAGVPGVPSDAGSASDSGEAFDSGPFPDAGGTVGDAGPSLDAGSVTDGGEQPDAGGEPDAGVDNDAGPREDAGGHEDAGRHEDAGMREDAGNETGDGGANDAGCSGSITFTVDNAASQTFSSICNGSWGSADSSTAVAYLYQGGPPPGVRNLIIDGCATELPGSGGLNLTLFQSNGTGTYTNGMATYTDSAGGSWGSNGGPFSVDVTAYGSTGEPVDGTFNATTANNADAGHVLVGSFHACRVPDEDTP